MISSSASLLLFQGTHDQGMRVHSTRLTVMISYMMPLANLEMDGLYEGLGVSTRGDCDYGQTPAPQKGNGILTNIKISGYWLFIIFHYSQCGDRCWARRKTSSHEVLRHFALLAIFEAPPTLPTEGILTKF